MKSEAVLLMAMLVAASVSLAQVESALIAKGEKVYAEKQCVVCHMIRGKGGKVGSDLSQVGTKRDEQWLWTFIKDPKSVNPQSKMMALKGSEEDLEALVAYMASLK